MRIASGGHGGYLLALSCPTAAECWAVGMADDGDAPGHDAQHMLFFHYTKGHWVA